MYFILSLNECMLNKCICIMLYIRLMLMTVAYMQSTIMLYGREYKDLHQLSFWARFMDLCFDLISRVHYNYIQCSPIKYTCVMLHIRLMFMTVAYLYVEHIHVIWDTNWTTLQAFLFDINKYLAGYLSPLPPERREDTLPHWYGFSHIYNDLLNHTRVICLCRMTTVSPSSGSCLKKLLIAAKRHVKKGKLTVK